MWFLKGKILFAFLCERNFRFTEMDPEKLLCCEVSVVEAVLFHLFCTVL